MKRLFGLALIACTTLATVVPLAGCGQEKNADGRSSPASTAASRLWAAGGSGTILATTDGGAHWTVQRSGTEYPLYYVAFGDASHGWVIGGELVVATTDGGLT